MARILLTGSEGLVGRSLRRGLEAAGHDVVRFDIRGAGPVQGDVRDPVALARAVAGCVGVVHLAAVSRVVEAEANPLECRATNEGGVARVLAAVAAQPNRPWVIVASSREIYGNPAKLPADEDSPARPINLYAESKVAGERLVAEAAAAGLRAMTVRLSNVYGDPADYPDRVVPAFALAAARGGVLEVCGPGHMLDFTHIDDVVRGLVRLVGVFGEAGIDVPTLHFVTGRGTRLDELAAMAVALAGRRCRIVEAPPTGLHVGHFIGCGARARAYLDWESRIDIEEGLRRLVEAYAAGRAA
jgi:nucleoside-diphosphate-sugar epimerase